MEQEAQETGQSDQTHKLLPKPALRVVLWKNAFHVKEQGQENNCVYKVGNSGRYDRVGRKRGHLGHLGSENGEERAFMALSLCLKIGGH